MTFIPFAELRQIEAQVKGKTLIWEESFAPLSDDPQWHTCKGRIKAISRRNDGYFVSDEHGASRWICRTFETCRNIRIEGE